jgi:hypothetical protein
LQAGLSIDSILTEIRGRRTRYLSLALIVVLSAVIWSLVVTPIYRSEAVISIAGESGQMDLSSNASGLSGLAALAGLPLGQRTHKEEVIATLKARATAEGFIRQENLLGTLMDATWDPGTNSWKPRSGHRPVLMADAVERWRKQVLHVDDDRETGLVTVAIEWRSAQTAADWDNRYLRFADSRIRDYALHEAEGSVNYLESQLARTQEVELRRSIAQLLEGQLKTVTLARVRNWYSLKVIDEPHVPARRFKPIRTLVAALSAILATILVVLVAAVSLLLAPPRTYR